MLTVKIQTDSAAFGDAPEEARREAARILRLIARRIEDGEDTGKFQTVFDINGNDVGRWKLGAE